MFSVDDVINFDLPVIIDYILAVTGQTKVNWVGYSLGTAVAMGLGSVHPEYSRKINLLFLLGTIAYVGNTKSPLMRALAPFAKAQDVSLGLYN
jgi:pimeloyl-ACP methyl ester carboxylesterase